MTFALPDILLVLTVGMGLAIIAGFLIVAARDHASGQHPEGRNGRLRDEALRFAPVLPYLVIMLGGWTFDAFRDQQVYLWLLGLGLLGMVLGHQIPAVKRARARLKALEGYPPQ